ncbi:reverse transcriptase [Corchorus olitorius]|uniref:Reverse transcriptase n=1 Tax=Corchorus olitorius TaxID=93759 RepID=A0A1R3INC8_9ROSI|nr:reverse transcriptase [Corchorus olitorius]
MRKNGVVWAISMLSAVKQKIVEVGLLMSTRPISSIVSSNIVTSWKLKFKEELSLGPIIEQRRITFKRGLIRYLQQWNGVIFFNNAQGWYEPNIASDHNPVFLSLDKIKGSKKRDFRFESKWLLDDDCPGVVEEGWTEPVNGSRMFKLARKLTATRNKLKKWSKEKFKNPRLAIEAMKKRIQAIQALPVTDSLKEEAIATGHWQGFRINRRCPLLSHLLFADDCILFSAADQKNCDVIMDILDKFKNATGQMVNFSKSAVYFSSNVNGTCRRDLRNKLSVQDMAHDKLAKTSSRQERTWLGDVMAGTLVAYVVERKLSLSSTSCSSARLLRLLGNSLTLAIHRGGKALRAFRTGGIRWPALLRTSGPLAPLVSSVICVGIFGRQGTLFFLKDKVPSTDVKLWKYSMAAPSNDSIKINCDAAFDKATGETGLAAVCRDHTGAIVDGISCVAFADSVDVAEALAVRMLVN